jgi:hypothetical protein
MRNLSRSIYRPGVVRVLFVAAHRPRAQGVTSFVYLHADAADTAPRPLDLR